MDLTLQKKYKLAQPLIQKMLHSGIISRCPEWLFEKGIEYYYNNTLYKQDYTIHSAYFLTHVTIDKEITFLIKRTPDIHFTAYPVLHIIEEFSYNYGTGLSETEHLVRLHEL